MVYAYENPSHVQPVVARGDAGRVVVRLSRQAIVSCRAGRGVLLHQAARTCRATRPRGLMRYAAPTSPAGARPRYTCPRLLSVPSHGAPATSASQTRLRTAVGSKSSVAHAGRNASGQSSVSSISHRHAKPYGLVPRG